MMIFDGRYSIRTLFLATTAVAMIYGCLVWFGLLAHIVVWCAALLAGFCTGFILGVKRLKETDPIVNAVQGGALGGAAGFVAAFLLLLPAYLGHPGSLILAGLIVGAQAAFGLGGFFGLAAGAIRVLLKAWSARTVKVTASAGLPVDLPRL